jgi:hypothetical protein
MINGGERCVVPLVSVDVPSLTTILIMGQDDTPVGSFVKGFDTIAVYDAKFLERNHSQVTNFAFSPDV